MIYKRMLIATILLVAMAALSANATAESMNTGYDDEVTAVSVDSLGQNFIFRPLTVSSSITQGQTNWHAKVVSGYYTCVEVDLKWDNSGNSLRLTISAPDSSSYGPYFDGDDGSVDGRIHKNINCPNGVPEGT